MWLEILTAFKYARFRSSSSWLKQNKSWYVHISLRSLPRYSVMGAGGSTTCRSSPVLESPRPTSTPKPPEEHQDSSAISNSHSQHQRENLSGCCDHREQNHAAFDASRSGSKAPENRQGSIDDEIEEIVANTIDLANAEESATRVSAMPRSQNSQASLSHGADIQARLSPNFVVGMTEKLQRTDTVTLIERLPNIQPTLIGSQMEDTVASGESSTKETQQEIDFAKFKRANNRGASLQRHGKLIHHQDSDLLWRLGLISPETYTIKPSPRSAPTMQGAYLKPPSYDLSEEQLMANIEKEFTECTSAKV